MKKYWFYFFIFNLLPIITFGQSDYYAKDSSLIIGVELVYGNDNLNSRLCRVKNDGKIKDYSPYEVNEFGYKDGRVYVSKEVQVLGTKKRVFLERLHRGKVILYYYKTRGFKTFFIEKDSALFLEIPKHNKEGSSFKEQLTTLTNDCENIGKLAKFAHYNKKSMTKLIDRYDGCELKPFPHFRYGLIIGYNLTKLNPPIISSNDYIKYFGYKFDGCYTIGLFMDNPFLSSDLSLHTEFYYSKHGFSYNKKVDYKDLDFVTNINTFNVPILLKYTYPSKKIRPYVDMGVFYTYNVNIESKIYEAAINNNIIVIAKESEVGLISKNQLGLSIGFGIEYKLNIKNSLFFELRYNRQNGMNDINSKDSKYFRSSEIHYVIGINI
jgi:hypothetical protein